MSEPIEVNYEPDGDDWTITARRGEHTLTGRAPGLIAARDRADQLVERLAPREQQPTVVHLLNGDALAFTSTYLSARLARPLELPPGLALDEPGQVPTPAPRADSESAERATST